MRILTHHRHFIHGLLHIPGFIKAFGMAALPQLPHPISRVHGIFWAVASILLLRQPCSFELQQMVAGICKPRWLFRNTWSSATGKMRDSVLHWTLLSLWLRLLAMGCGASSSHYNSEVQNLRKQSDKEQTQPLELADLAHLPEPVRMYVWSTRERSGNPM